MIMIEIPAVQPLTMAMACNNKQQKHSLSVLLLKSTMIPQGLVFYLFDRLLYCSSFFPEVNREVILDMLEHQMM